MAPTVHRPSPDSWTSLSDELSDQSYLLLLPTQISLLGMLCPLQQSPSDRNIIPIAKVIPPHHRETSSSQTLSRFLHLKPCFSRSSSFCKGSWLCFIPFPKISKLISLCPGWTASSPQPERRRICWARHPTSVGRASVLEDKIASPINHQEFYRKRIQHSVSCPTLGKIY